MEANQKIKIRKENEKQKAKLALEETMKKNHKTVGEDCCEQKCELNVVSDPRSTAQYGMDGLYEETFDNNEHSTPCGYPKSNARNGNETTTGSKTE